MTKLVHTIFICYPPGHLRPAQCTVRIYAQRGFPCVLLTERLDNPGMSVTNAAEQIATELVKQFHLEPRTTRWIEHYPARYGVPETFEAVSFTWQGKTASAPRWRRVPPSWVHYWTGERVDAQPPPKTTRTIAPVASFRLP